MARQKKKLTSGYIGKQLSRFKNAMSYLTLAMTAITAFNTTKLIYPLIQLSWFVLALPFIILATILFGFFLDRLNISTHDQRKSNEMTHRFLLTSDIKSQQFQLVQTKMLLNALKAMKDGEEINIDEIMKSYDEYLLTWKSPENDLKNL
jgi:hypothetical protein